MRATNLAILPAFVYRFSSIRNLRLILIIFIALAHTYQAISMNFQLIFRQIGIHRQSEMQSNKIIFISLMRWQRYIEVNHLFIKYLFSSQYIIDIKLVSRWYFQVHFFCDRMTDPPFKYGRLILENIA